MILTCDGRYNTFDLKKKNKTLYWRSYFQKLKKIKKSSTNSKSGRNNQNFVKKTFLLLKYQKLLTFLVKKNNHNFFLGAFIWNHPIVTRFRCSLQTDCAVYWRVGALVDVKPCCHLKCWQSTDTTEDSTKTHDLVQTLLTQSQNSVVS